MVGAMETSLSINCNHCLVDGPVASLIRGRQAPTIVLVVGRGAISAGRPRARAGESLTRCVADALLAGALSASAPPAPLGPALHCKPRNGAAEMRCER